MATCGTSSMLYVDAQGRVCATRSISAGDTISFINGEIVDTERLLERIRSGRCGVEAPHQIGADLYIVPDALSRGFGHSCLPNAGIRHVNEVFALRNIGEHEPVTYDFSTTVGVSIFDGLFTMECQCGLECCRGSIGSVLTLSTHALRAYAIAGALPSFILAQLIRHRHLGRPLNSQLPT
jgi:hypothetical protein